MGGESGASVDALLRKSLPYNPRSHPGPATVALRNIYEPLADGTIRLLDITDWDSKEDLLRCRLLRRSLKSEHGDPYSAVSYTWNEKNRAWYGRYSAVPKPIIMNGLPTVVSNKVANFLCMLYLRGKKRVWIDALCINQQDREERSRQVLYMDAVYRSAQEVIIMLGPPTSNTDAGIDWLNSVAETGTALSTISIRVRKGLITLLFNAYWTRAWPLQELLLARNTALMYGTRIIASSAIQKLDPVLGKKRNFLAVLRNQSLVAYTLRWLIEYPRIIPAMMRQDEVLWDTDMLFNQVDENIHEVSTPIEKKMLRLMKITQQWHNCKDPRDILYCRYGLAEDARLMIPVIDYSLSPENVYLNFAINYIRTYDCLEIIEHARASTRELPSWCPDWSHKVGPWDACKQIEIPETLWTRPPKIEFSSDFRELIVAGRVFAKLDKRTSRVVGGGEGYKRAIWPLALKVTSFGHAFASCEWPREHDLLCALQGYSKGLVFLRPQAEHYTIVGRIGACTYDLDCAVRSGAFDLTPASRTLDFKAEISTRLQEAEVQTFRIR